MPGRLPSNLHPIAKMMSRVGLSVNGISILYIINIDIMKYNIINGLARALPGGEEEVLPMSFNGLGKRIDPLLEYLDLSGQFLDVSIQLVYFGSSGKNHHDQCDDDQCSATKLYGC
jgi:hypothetical protein